MHSATSTHGRKSRRKRRLAAGAAAPVALLVLAAGAFGALQHLPNNGAQVNDDPANRSTRTRTPASPTSSAARSRPVRSRSRGPRSSRRPGASQQIFVRAFKNGAWVTQGFPASLNIDPTDGGRGAVDRLRRPGPHGPVGGLVRAERGPPRPRRTSSPAASTRRPTCGCRPARTARPASVPSLNIHTLRTAENPSVAGGATVAGRRSGSVGHVGGERRRPTTTTTRRQIFVAKALKQAVARNLPGRHQAGRRPDVNGFCWQQVGLDRLNPTSPTSSATGDPTLNIDPTRSGVEPDIAFTGPNDTVAVGRLVRGGSDRPRRPAQQRAWSSRPRSSPTRRGRRRLPLARRRQRHGRSDRTCSTRSGAHGFGGCAESQDAEDACSLNAVPSRDAENPRVAAGTLTPGGTTVPWVVWHEEIGGGKHAIFVSRLVGGDHFELFNRGQPISNTVNDCHAARHHVLRQRAVHLVAGGRGRRRDDVRRHFEGGRRADLQARHAGRARSAAGLVADLRAPISSGCTATPFNADGATARAARSARRSSSSRTARRLPAAVRRVAQADEAEDARGVGHHGRRGDAERLDRPDRRRPGRGPLRVRHDDGLRAVDGRDAARPVRRAHVLGHRERPALGHDVPLPRVRADGLRRPEGQGPHVPTN